MSATTCRAGSRLPSSAPGSDVSHCVECSVPGCARPARCRMLCNANYKRWCASGDVQADVPVAKHRRGRTENCSVAGCELTYRSKGLCAVHYMEKFGAGLKDKPCSIAGCTRVLYRRGWCVPHYQRWQAYGDPLAGPPGRAVRGTGPPKWEKDQIRRVAKAKISQVSGETREYVAIIRGDPCAYCGAPMEHVDHIVPFADGGVTDWTNLTPACAGCNHRKSKTPLLFFLLSARGGDLDGQAA